jgi:hypothetical protein
MDYTSLREARILLDSANPTITYRLSPHTPPIVPLPAWIVAQIAAKETAEIWVQARA